MRSWRSGVWILVLPNLRSQSSVRDGVISLRSCRAFVASQAVVCPRQRFGGFMGLAEQMEKVGRVTQDERLDAARGRTRVSWASGFATLAVRWCERSNVDPDRTGTREQRERKNTTTSRTAARPTETGRFPEAVAASYVSNRRHCSHSLGKSARQRVRRGDGRAGSA